MTRAELIKERLEEIDAELNAAPRQRRRDFSAVSLEDILEDDFVAVTEWPARRAELIEERRRLQREFDRLPKHAKD